VCSSDLSIRTEVAPVKRFSVKHYNPDYLPHTESGSTSGGPSVAGQASSVETNGRSEADQEAYDERMSPSKSPPSKEKEQSKRKKAKKNSKVKEPDAVWNEEELLKLFKANKWAR